MPKKHKYNNYAELAAAFKSGELTEHHYLMLDKGANENSLNYYNPAESEEENERKQEECGPWLADIEVTDAFTALGIRWQWC